MTVRSKAEARSDLCIWDASQMIVLFNPLRSRFFVIVQNCTITIIMLRFCIALESLLNICLLWICVFNLLVIHNLKTTALWNVW